MLGADDLVDYTTPEDLIIAKELMELIIDHFGENDAKVLLGYSRDRTLLFRSAPSENGKLCAER